MVDGSRTVGKVGQGEEEEGEGEAVVAAAVGGEHWRMEEGSEQSGRDKEGGGGWQEGKGSVG